MIEIEKGLYKNLLFFKSTKPHDTLQQFGLIFNQQKFCNCHISTQNVWKYDLQSVIIIKQNDQQFLTLICYMLSLENKAFHLHFKYPSITPTRCCDVHGDFSWAQEMQFEGADLGRSLCLVWTPLMKQQRTLDAVHVEDKQKNIVQQWQRRSVVWI